MAKEVTKKRSYENKHCNLSIFHHIKQGLSIGVICYKLSISKRAMSYHLKQLKASGSIKKIGYGVWETTDVVPKQVTKSSLVHTHFKSIRSHGFGFYLKIPKIHKWNKRKEYLIKHNIKFKPSKLTNVEYQRFVYKNFHVWLFNNGIKFLSLKEKNQYVSNSATLGKELAIKRIIEVIKGLEKLFNTTFSIEKKYNVKVTRQHQANVKNELAEHYRKTNKKLKGFDERGLWLLIDISLNTAELETVRGPTAHLDMDNVVMPLMNSCKDFQSKTGEPFTLDHFNRLAHATEEIVKNQAHHEANIKSHVLAIQEMGSILKELKDELKK